MNILRYSNLYFLISGFLIGAAIVALLFFGLKFSIEFTGGSILEIAYQTQRPQAEEVYSSLSSLGFQSSQLQEVGDKGMLLRLQDVSEDLHQKILSELGPDAKELRFESVGPVIGKELQRKTFVFSAFSFLIIVSYVAFAFRKISFPLKAWHWGLVSLLALFHDVIIPLGMFALLGKFMGIEFGIPVVVALLTVVGYSISNNIVVFDRMRENLLRKTGFDLEDTVNRSIRETLGRNINTSITTLIPLSTILVFGGSTLQGFSLALIAGITVGLYSSVFFCPSVLVRGLGNSSKS